MSSAKCQLLCAAVMFMQLPAAAAFRFHGLNGRQTHETEGWFLLLLVLLFTCTMRLG